MDISQQPTEKERHAADALEAIVFAAHGQQWDRLHRGEAPEMAAPAVRGSETARIGRIEKIIQEWRRGRTS